MQLQTWNGTADVRYDGEWISSTIFKVEDVDTTGWQGFKFVRKVGNNYYNFSSWSTDFNKRFFIHAGSDDNGTWENKTPTLYNVTFQVTFTSDVPEYADIYIPGAFNGWSTNVATSKMTRVSNTVFSYSANNLLANTYEYLVVACYSGASAVDYNHKIDTSNQSISVSAAGNVSLGSRTYDFATKMPQKKAPEGAQVQLTFASQVPNSVDIIYVGGLTNWGNTKADMDAGKMTGNAGRTVFTWDIPENTYIGDYSYKIVAMSKYTKVTAVVYADIVYGAADHDETLTIDETTLTYPLTANDYDLSDLGAFAFAEGFIDATKDICADEDANNKAGLEAIWATWKSNFEGLTEGAKSAFASSESETIVQARSLYLHCVTRYSLEAWTDAPTSSNAVTTINFNKVATNNAWIIVVISSIAIVSLLGAGLMIKRRKEDR